MISLLHSWGTKATASVSELSSLIGLLIFLSQIIGGIKATIGILILQRTTLNRASRLTFVVSDRIRVSVAHIAYVLEKWHGHAIIFDRYWFNSQADITIYCDIAKDKVPQVGSYGKGAFCIPKLSWFSETWTSTELDGAMRKTTHSTAHLELINMLDAVLRFAATTQKVLCYCDNKAAVAIARARYSETANADIEERLRKFDVACCEHNLVVRFRWQSRESPLPKLADELSRGKVAPLSLCGFRLFIFSLSFSGHTYMMCLGTRVGVENKVRKAYHAFVSAWRRHVGTAILPSTRRAIDRDWQRWDD